jgi:cyanate permease
MIIRPVPNLVPPLAALLPSSPDPYVAMLLIGFAAGALGHMVRQRWLVVVGVALIFLGAFLFPIAVKLTNDKSPPPTQTAPG